MDKDAFEISDSIRYSDDKKTQTLSFEGNRLKLLELGLSLQALKVSKEITPTIYDSLEKVCNNLNLAQNKVSVYISPSSEIQAQCISFDTEACIITLSSELANSLNSDELGFVMGHELGHFLFSHPIENIVSSKESLIALRAKEISVDRVGLWACRDLDIAMKAIIKTLSGLDDRLLRFDINFFLKQIEYDTIPVESQQSYSSHPSLLLRAKSLLRFSLSNEFQNLVKGTKGSGLAEIDKLIKKDLDFYSDSQIRNEIKVSRELVEFWITVHSIIKSGSLTKNNQELIADRFGEDKKTKLINMLEGMDKKEAEDLVKEKIKSTVSDFTEAAPNESKKELNLIIEKIEEETNSPGLLKEIQRFI